MKNISSILIVSILLLLTKTISAQCTLNVVSTTNVLCNGGNDGSLIVNMSNAVNYTLQPGNVTNATGNFSNLVANTYTVTGTDNINCNATTVVTIYEPTVINIISQSFTSPVCFGGNNGTISVSASGGTGAITYTISPLGPQSNTAGIFSNLAAQTYTVTATDMNSCTSTTIVNVTQPPAVSINITSSTAPSCIPGCDGTAQVTTQAGLVYSITGPGNPMVSSTGTASLLCTGYYVITATDANGCTGSTTIQLVNQSLAPISVTSQSDASCFNVCDGLIQIILLPGINYYISGPGNPTINASGVASNLCAGYYAITATDSNACTTIGITINAPSPLTVSIPTMVLPSCSPGCDGLINASGIGGIGPYTYNILPSGPTQPTTGNFTSLCGGTTYTVSIVDANGCMSNTSIPVTSSLYNPSIQLGITVNNASISSNPSGGTPPYQFSLNGGPFSTTNTFNLLCSGTYTLTVKDSYGGAGCLKDTVLNIQAATSFPGGTVTPYIVNPTCSLSNNGMISLVITPANNYTFQWNNNQTTSYLNNIQAGVYSVQILNATNECVELSIPLNSVGINCGNISGNVYYDSTLNCVQEAFEDIIPGTMIVANPGNHITFTDAFGNYAYNQLPYGTYTISHQNNINAFQTHCGNNFNASLSAANPNQIVNFGDSLTINMDYQVFLSWQNCFVVPNPNKFKHIFYHHNNPGYPSTGKLYAVFDSINHYVSSNPSHTSISGDTVFWNVTNITNAYQSIQVNFTFPTTYTTANTFPFTIGLSNLQYPDTNLLNNQINYTIPFCNSYDPNDKHVAPKGEGPNGNILASDLLLTYNINFQNTGNAPAYNIVIEDTLSDKLDITTLNMLMVSHPYQLEIVNNQTIKWKFYNIMLPDSTANEPASHGHIHYQIRQKNGNQIGDVIKNKAYIYFDYNPPIITNETVNTIYQPTGIKNTSSLGNQVVIYPNPASNEVYIDAEKEFTQYTIYNQQMSVIESKSFASTKTKKLNISSWSNGIYFIKTNNGEMKKLVVQR